MKSGLATVAWTTKAAAHFWIAHGVASALAAEGLPYGHELRVLVLLLALAPHGSAGTGAAVESLIGPLLHAAAPAAEAIRSVIRACLTLLSRTARNSVGPIHLLLASFLQYQVAQASGNVGSHRSQAAAEAASARLELAAAEIDVLAASVRCLRRRREARALARPLLLRVLGSELRAEPAAMLVAASAEPVVRDGRGSAPHELESAIGPSGAREMPPSAGSSAPPEASASPEIRLKFIVPPRGVGPAGLLDVDWEGAVLPAVVVGDGRGAQGDDDDAEPGGPADALSDAASLFRSVLDAAGAVRDEAARATRHARRQAGSAGRAEARDADIGRPFVSPAQASNMTRSRLQRQFGRAAEFVSPRHDGGVDGVPVRASIATYGGGHS